MKEYGIKFDSITGDIGVDGMKNEV